jgi:hypothetical protein
MQTSYKQFEITSKSLGSIPCEWDNGRNHNADRVTVKNVANGLKTSFKFYQSIASPCFKDEQELLSAFRCFVDDAISGTYDFDEFCSEFGYEKPSLAYKTWRECQKALRRFKRIYDGDLYELLDELPD